MDNQPEGQETQNTPESNPDIATKVEIAQAELDELRKKANSSSQNFERLKKAEEELKELRALKEGKQTDFDPAKFQAEVDDKVAASLAGYSSEELTEIEAYAKGRGITRMEAAKSPFIQKAVEALRSAKKSTEATPASSSKIKVFNGKPVDKIFKEGTPEEKQAAFEARIRGGVNSSE